VLRVVASATGEAIQNVCSGADPYGQKPVELAWEILSG
jgi:hypothetical protein